MTANAISWVFPKLLKCISKIHVLVHILNESMIQLTDIKESTVQIIISQCVVNSIFQTFQNYLCCK